MNESAFPLSLRDIKRTFVQGDRRLDVLRGVTLDLRPGEIVALVGQSGSGKSTLLHIAGLLEQVGLGKRTSHYPKLLSGGEQQRVAIARALVNEPSVLLADEPTGNLDERATRGVFQLLRDINASGTAVVMATHDLDLVRQAPYRVIELQEGALVYDSAVDESRDQAAAP